MEKEVVMQLIINDPDEIKRAINAKNLCSFVYDFQEYLRHKRAELDNIETEKMEPNEKIKIDCQYEFVDKLIEEWYDMLYSNGVILDELWY